MSNELSVMKKLDSPYIIKLYDSFVENGFSFIVMEYCNGETLKEYIQKVNPLDR